MTVRIGKSVIASLAVALMAVWHMTSGVAPAQAGVIGAAGIAPAFAAANADQGHTLVGSRHGRGFGRHGGFRRFGGLRRHGEFGRRGDFRRFGGRGRHGEFGRHGDFRRFGGRGRHGEFGRRGDFRGFGHRGGFRRHDGFGLYGWHRGFFR